MLDSSHLPSVHHVPVGDCVGLLASLVPHSTEHDKGGLANGFERSEKRTDNDEPGEVVGSGMARYRVSVLQKTATKSEDSPNIPPQMMIEIPSVLAIGTRVINTLIGYSMMRMAM